jgi:PAS domain S-box-containing protein
MSLIEALLDSAMDAVMLVDANGRLALVNHRTEELFGYGPGALFGSSVEQLVPGPSRSEHAGHRADYAASPRARRMGVGLELSGLREDGSEFPIEVSLTPIAVEAEDFVITVVRDVSDKRAAEREHVELTHERAAHAESELDRERLAAIVGEIDAIVWDADVGRRRFSFVSGRAEELLGYPLSAWLGEDDFWRRIVEPGDLELAELLFEEAVAGASDHDHEYRVRGADGQLRWVRDRVHIALGEGGEARLRGLTVDVTARRALEEDLMQAQKMDAVGEFADGVGHDFGNLLVVINRQTELLLGRVRDDVSRAQLQEISAAAVRASELVAQLLAFGRGRAIVSGLDDLQQSSAAGSPDDGDAPVVLVVQDESAVRLLVRSVLEGSGYRVREAVNGRDALAYLEQKHAQIDLVLSDVMTPGVTGPEIVARLAPLGLATRVLLISGHSDSHLLTTGQNEPSVGVLHKPFTPAELATRVAQLMSEEPAGG